MNDKECVNVQAVKKCFSHNQCNMDVLHFKVPTQIFKNLNWYQCALVNFKILWWCDISEVGLLFFCQICARISWNRKKQSTWQRDYIHKITKVHQPGSNINRKVIYIEENERKSFRNILWMRCTYVPRPPLKLQKRMSQSINT